MADTAKPPTHKAYAYRREGRRMRFGRWLEIGTGRDDEDGAVHVFLDRMPIGGFTGYVYLAPIGTKPPITEPHPERPDPLDGDGSEGHPEA
jgi:hypothetical protein